MKRALVLGGGGVIGVAWETGLCLGLAEAGLAPNSVDMIVGTSAGGLVGAQVRAGLLKRPGSATEGASRSAALDFSQVDPLAVGKVFALWRELGKDAGAAAAIGAIARVQNRPGEAAFVEQLAGSIGVRSWPEGGLRICAVDTQDGSRRVFERDSGADVARVLASTAAVPGLFPSVEIDGALYMDGQVHSSTNADVLLGERPAQVLIAMPTNQHNARSVGRHAEQMVASEITALEAAGCRVWMTTPTAEEVGKMGSNLMDPAGAPAAFEIGLATGKRWAADVLG